MKKKLTIAFTASVVAGLLPFVANADEVSSDWSGAYAGVNLGYSSGENHLDSLDGISNTNYNGGEGYTTGSFSPQKGNQKGSLGGAQVGYNFQSGRIVYGLEADIQKSDIKGNVSSNLYIVDENCGCAPNTLNQTFEQKVDWFGTIRGQLGYSFNNILLYGTGGLALAGVKTNASNIYSAYGDNDVSSPSDKQTQVGWTLGAGAKFAIYKNWIIDAQYQHISLSNENYHYYDSTNNINLVSQNNSNFDVFKMGVNYKF